MKRHSGFVAAGRTALMGMLALGHTLQAGSPPLAKHPIVTAVHQHKCAQAISMIHSDVGDNDAPTAFLAARMLDEGICVKSDPDQAAPFFARAADLGNRAAVLDYAAKVGLGVGAHQDFARAGELCHAAGIDGKQQLQVAALGYSCTVASIAGRLLRERLPEGAFTSMAGAVVNVEFVPASGSLQIVSVPAVRRAESTTGSYVGRPVVDAKQEVGNTWRDALQMVPAPETARTENHAVALSIDVDMTLELGRASQPDDLPVLLPGDIGMHRLTGH